MLLSFGTNGCGQFGASTLATTKLSGGRSGCTCVSARALLPKELGGHIPRSVSASPTCTALVTDSGKCLCIGLSPLHTMANLGRNIVAPTVADIRFCRIACGHAHILAVSERGELWGWGDNSCLQLGSVSTRDVTRPKRLGALVPCKVIDIAAGKRHSIALGDTGAAYSWGSNEYGQLGIGEGRVDGPFSGAAPSSVDVELKKVSAVTKETDLPPKPVFNKCMATAQRVAADAPIAAVAAGWEHSAFVTKAGVILTCGFGM